MRISKLFPFLCVVLFNSAMATSILDMSDEEMLRQAGELRLKLNLTAAQTIPWLQAESRTREVLREQKGRRERFQITLSEQLNKPQFDLESVAVRLDSEDTQAQEERQRLRKIWLSALKGLTEPQGNQLREFLRTILDSQSMTPPPAQSLPSLGGEEQPKLRGVRGNRSGGGMSGGMKF